MGDIFDHTLLCTHQYANRISTSNRYQPAGRLGDESRYRSQQANDTFDPSDH